jgi:hypothetical protein
MCDCYDAKCHSKGCGEMLPVHLGDYNTKRDEIEVFCKQHLPIAGCRIFTITQSITYGGEKKKVLKKGWKMGIRYLTDNAKKNAVVNHPNLGVDWTEEDI